VTIAINFKHFKAKKAGKQRASHIPQRSRKEYCPTLYEQKREIRVMMIEKGGIVVMMRENESTCKLGRSGSGESVLGRESLPTQGWEEHEEER